MTQDRSAARGRQAPLRECDNGCGRRRRSWRDPFICGSCLRVLQVEREGRESLRDFRRRLQEGEKP